MPLFDADKSPQLFLQTQQDSATYDPFYIITGIGVFISISFILSVVVTQDEAPFDGWNVDCARSHLYRAIR